MRKTILLIACVLTGLASTVSADPGPATAPTTRPELLQPQTPAQKLFVLGRTAIAQIRQHKLDDAEATLNDALQIDPHEATDLYNMACVQSSFKGKTAPALDSLEHAAEAGFTDFQHIEHDGDLDSLRAEPRYKALMARKDELERQTADAALAALKARFGDKYLYEIDPASKLIFATNTDADTLQRLKQGLQEQSTSQWKQLFDNRPEHYISVVLPSMVDYQKIVQRPGVEGFYNHDARILIADRLGQVMTHEFTHAMQDGDLDLGGQDPPIWITEGLAVMYEASIYDNGNLVPQDNFRLPYIQSAARQNRLIPLKRLVKLDQPQFIGRPLYTYGESGSVMLYLFERGQLKRFYDHYKETYESDRTGVSALQDVTGEKIDDFDMDWRRWMVARTPPALNPAPGTAYLGMRFVQVNDGLKVLDISNGGPADRAGFRDGDIVVGISGLDVRDYQSFMPQLESHRPGEIVNLRIRRADQYLDVPVVLGTRGRPFSAATTRPAAQ